MTWPVCMEKIKRWLVGSVVLLIAGFVMLNVLAYNHAHAMMHFASQGTRTSKPEDLSFCAKLKVLSGGVNIPRPSSERLPSDLAPGCRTLSVVSSPDVSLATWYCDRGAETPLVILFHGYCAEKASMLREAKALLGLGVSVLLVDFRGSGGSSESYTTIGVREGDDVAAVARYARDSLSHSAVILYGQSMGAGAVLRAVSRNGATPNAVILAGVFDTMLNTVRNRFASMGIPSFPSAQLLVFWGGVQWGFNGFAHNPADYARSVNCPTLVMHGADDPRAKVTEGRRVFAAVPGPKEFREFGAVGHESYVSKHPGEWRAAVAEIIRKVDLADVDGID